MFEIFNTVHW